MTKNKENWKEKIKNEVIRDCKWKEHHKYSIEAKNEAIDLAIRKTEEHFKEEYIKKDNRLSKIRNTLFDEQIKKTERRAKSAERKRIFDKVRKIFDSVISVNVLNQLEKEMEESR